MKGPSSRVGAEASSINRRGKDQQPVLAVTEHGAPPPVARVDGRRRRYGAAPRLHCHATDSADTDRRDTCEYRRPCPLAGTQLTNITQIDT